MIIYNVTVNVDQDVVSSWLKYMKERHIPDVMATGCFEKYSLCKLLTQQADEVGESFTVQYHCESMEKYDHYNDEFSVKLQSEHNDLFGGKFVAFRSLMVVLD